MKNHTIYRALLSVAILALSTPLMAGARGDQFGLQKTPRMTTHSVEDKSAAIATLVVGELRPFGGAIVEGPDGKQLVDRLEIAFRKFLTEARKRMGSDIRVT